MDIREFGTLQILRESILQCKVPVGDMEFIADAWGCFADIYLAVVDDSVGLVQRLHQLGVTPVVTSDAYAHPPTRDSTTTTLPLRPDSLILGAPVNHKESQRQEDADNDRDEVGEEALESTDTERTIEGSSGTESRKQSYGELEGTFNNELAKEEPAVVSLEFGVARMTC